ncbi:MAG: hypothetical protein ACYS5V_00110 [Planctomycetota bacterium]
MPRRSLLDKCLAMRYTGDVAPVGVTLDNGGEMDTRYEDIGPDYFASLLGSELEPAEVLSCERGSVHDEHMSNPDMSRWRVAYRRSSRRGVASFVAKKLRPGHERELPIYRWLQENTDVNMPALVDYRHDPDHDNCWLLTENCVNYKDMEYYYLCRYYFAPPDTWPPATEPCDPNDAFTRPLADLHGKTLGRDWARIDHEPIPTYQPPAALRLDVAEAAGSLTEQGLSLDAATRAKVEEMATIVASLSAARLYERISTHLAITHGSMNYQEVGFRIDVNFEPTWCLFDWENARIAPIYFDLAQVHYGMGKTIGAEQMAWYVDQVRRLSGVALDASAVREAIDIAVLFAAPQWVCGAVKHGEREKIDVYLKRLRALR